MLIVGTRIIYRNDDTEYRTEIGGRQRSGQWPGQRSRDYYDDVDDEGVRTVDIV